MLAIFCATRLPGLFGRLPVLLPPPPSLTNKMLGGVPKRWGFFLTSVFTLCGRRIQVRLLTDRISTLSGHESPQVWRLVS